MSATVRSSPLCFAITKLTHQVDAFAAKAMPDLGLEIEDFQAQTWKIEKWSQQARRMQGPEFSCGGHKWYVVLVHS